MFKGIVGVIGECFVFVVYNVVLGVCCVYWEVMVVWCVDICEVCCYGYFVVVCDGYNI